MAEVWYSRFETDDGLARQCRECGVTTWPASPDPERSAPIDHDPTCAVGAAERLGAELAALRGSEIMAMMERSSSAVERSQALIDEGTAEITRLTAEVAALRGAGADERAEAAIMGHAEAYRQVREVKDMRERAEKAEAQVSFMWVRLEALEDESRLRHERALRAEADRDALREAADALYATANAHYWAYEDLDDPDDPEWRKRHDALAIAMGAYHALAAARGPARSGET